MILAHITVPLILYGIFSFYGIFSQQHLLALLIGANISSLDVLPTLIRRGPPRKPIEETHAATILHTLFFFAVLFAPFHFAFGPTVALAFTVGGFIHVFIDALDEKGRMLFYPLSKKFYGPGIFTYDFWTYTTDKKIFFLESCLFMAACALLLLQ